MAYNGQGALGGEPGDYGYLNLPTEVVSSEFLTMEGKKFASSRGIVIYVRDMLSRYQPDALRYFICAAGPETSDADFTWDEFVRRTNNELVAGWGNLVNRVASMIHKRFGEIPEPGELQPIDQALLDEVQSGFAVVGDLVGAHRQKAAINAVMRLVGEANRYVTETEPFKLKTDEQLPRLRTILWTLAQVVSDLNTMMSIFLPHSSNEIDLRLGGDGNLAPLPRIEWVDDLDVEGVRYPIITGDYAQPHSWERYPITVGTPIGKPAPVFVKLDPDLVDEELSRM